MAQRFNMPVSQWVNGNSVIQAGAKLYFYNNLTTTPKATYSDVSLSTPNAHPVVADADGEFGDIFLADGYYTVVLAPSSNTADPPTDSFWTRNYVNSWPAASAFMQTLLQDETAQEARDTLGVPGLTTVNTFTKTQEWAKGADIASAATLNLGDDGNYFDVTGTTTIEAISAKGVGTTIKLHFDGACQLTDSTDLVIPGGNYTTAAGDEIEFTEYANGDWTVTGYALASGGPMVTATIVEKFVSTAQALAFGSAGNLTLAHGLSGQPQIVQVWLKCITGEVGYATNDETLVAGSATVDGGNAYGIGVIPDATNVYLRPASSGPVVVNKSTNAVTTVTAGKWNIIVRAIYVP